MSEAGRQTEAPLAIIAGGGTLPFTVADSAIKARRKVVLFAIRGAADAARVAAYPHHWFAVTQLGLLRRLAQQEGCREMVLIGSLVRPPVWHFLFDLEGLRLLTRVVQAFRGGDNHLLSRLLDLLQSYGFTIRGAHEIAPEIVVDVGRMGTRMPDAQERADIVRGLALLDAISPFDVGQAVVVAGNQVIAVEGPEGTDWMLTRIAEMRRAGRLRGPAGTGVLVKAPKTGQDTRVDLPSIGPQTVEGAARAGLAGVAVLAGSSIVAEAERFAAAADSANIFVVGVRPDGSCE